MIATLTSSNTYRRLCGNLEKKIAQWACQGNEALRARDSSRLQECIDVLELIDVKVGTHVSLARRKSNEVKGRVCSFFVSWCKDCQHVLKSDEYLDFEGKFHVFREFALHVACLSTNVEAKSDFEMTNKSVFELMEREIKLVKESMHTHKFQEIKIKVLNIRRFGGFIADWYALFSEDLKNRGCTKNDEWVVKLLQMARTHFRDGRDLSRLKSFALLSTVPSASKDEVKRAFQRKSRKFHPDKCRDQSRWRYWNDRYIRIKDAKENLIEHLPDRETNENRKPFDEDVRSIGENLRLLTKQHLHEGDYDKVALLLFDLSNIAPLERLVNPRLDTQKIKDDIEELVSSHVKNIRITVDTNWTERKFKDLHTNITDLRRMGEHFRDYHAIFSQS